MTLQDLITLFRNEADDATEPYLWDDDEVTEFANDAEAEACRRARLLVDSTSALTQLLVDPLDAGVIALDPGVVFVRRATLAGRRPLMRVTVRDLDEQNPYWQNAAPGTPRAFVTDFQTGAILLYPVPAEQDLLLLTIVRTPLAEMRDLQDSPEIAPRFHRSLRYWMLYRAYSKQDSQANDPKKAADSLALFEQEFGKKSSAIDENWIAHEQMPDDGTY
jgi:hypothetical protein